MKIDYSKIWREIGDAFESPYKDRTKWQKDITDFGLCFAFQQILFRDYFLNSGEVNNLSYTPIYRLGRTMGLGLLWCSCSEINRYPRATFAYLMAAIGNREYKKLIKAVTP